MSRRGSSWSPRSRHGQYRHNGQGPSWGDRSYEPDNVSQDSQESVAPVRRPRHLRGREIGLYYRDRQLQRHKSVEGRREKKKQKSDDYINLKIPKAVEQKLSANLKLISSLSERPVKIKQENVDEISIKEEEDPEPQKNKEFQFKKPKLPQDSPEEPKATMSRIPDFIPVNNEVFSDYGDDTRQLSLRGAGDYKYGYEDIITGTFDQKLDECLARGIKINQQTPEINDMNLAINEDYFMMVKEPKYLKWLEFRKKLPTYHKSEELLKVIRNNQAIVISGETGCGKSTQVPQIILDAAMANLTGANVKILVTQPRRIAALSLAERVAQERGENLGKSVGYCMRLERVDCRERGSITFCTTGILLVEMETDQALTKYSHIILDEVHERDTHTDFAMCMLKKILRKREDLKLILMSATIDADKLSVYFDNCPMMHIEGLAYPVQDIYLEDILQMTKFQLPPQQQRNFGNCNSKRWHKHVKKFMTTMSEKEIQHRAEVGDWVDSQRKTKKLDLDVCRTLIDPRIEDIQIDLIFDLLVHICKGPPGAILVFLPGISEITKLMKLMNQSEFFPRFRFDIYPLHSRLPTVDQHKIFERPAGNIRKIIVATNIAETSITIDDIVYVIDSGKMKYTGLNVEQHISTLQTEWISKANLRQRRGRAGRVQPGICYHLLTSFRAEKLADRILPELQRSNLLEPVLTIKRLRLGQAENALKLVPDLPDMSTVRRAVKHLQQCGALDDKETLTPLGWHLARLPVHPAAGKLLVLATLLGCLDRAASLAAVWSFKDPFQMAIGLETEVEKAKQNFALGEPSDHVAMTEAILQWERTPSRDRHNFAYKNFLSHNTTELLVDMKKQLGDNLKQMGFLASGDVRAPWENRNANNLSLFKAVVAAALYPNIATVRWLGLRNCSNKKGLRIKVHTPEDGKIDLHPSSVMCASFKPGGKKVVCTNPGAGWLVYWLKQRSSNLFLIDITLVHTLPLLFFGELNVIEMEQEKCFICSKFKVRCSKEQADMLIELRKLLDEVLAAKITSNSIYSTTHSTFEENVLKAVIDIITAEDEGVDNYDDDDTTESDASECEPDTKRLNY